MVIEFALMKKSLEKSPFEFAYDLKGDPLPDTEVTISNIPVVNGALHGPNGLEKGLTSLTDRCGKDTEVPRPLSGKHRSLYPKTTGNRVKSAPLKYDAKSELKLNLRIENVHQKKSHENIQIPVDGGKLDTSDLNSTALKNSKHRVQ